MTVSESVSSLRFPFGRLSTWAHTVAPAPGVWACRVTTGLAHGWSFDPPDFPLCGSVFPVLLTLILFSEFDLLPFLLTQMAKVHINELYLLK